MSGAALASKLSSIRRIASGITTAAMGTLIQNIHCHGAPSAIAPPTTGPTMVATPVTPPNIPSALARSSLGKRYAQQRHRQRHDKRRPSVLHGGAPINWSASRANAHAAEAIANSKRPVMNSLRRP